MFDDGQLPPTLKSSFPSAFQKISRDIFPHYSFRLSKLFKHQDTRCCNLLQGMHLHLAWYREIIPM